MTLAVVAFAAIGLAILTIYAFQQRSIAVKESRNNRAYELSARSANLLGKDPTLSFRLAEAAFHTESANPEAYHRLLDAYYKGEFYRAVFHLDKTVKSAGFSADGAGVVMTGRDKTLHRDFDGKEIKSSGSAGTAVESKSSDTSRSGKTVTISEKPNVAEVRENGGSARELKGHTAEVKSVLFSSNGDYVLTVADDNTARLWNITAFQHRLRAFPGHTSERSDFYAVFSPDGSRILTVTSSKAILWDLQGNPVKQAVPADDLRLETPAFSPDGTVILFRTDSDEKIGRWDLDGEDITALELKGKPGVNQVAFSPDPGTNKILTANRDNNARLWDFKGGQLNELVLFEGHTNEVKYAAFSPDGKHIVTAGWDNTARLWGLNGKEITRFEGHEKVVNAVAVSKDGNYFLTASGDETARLWDRRGNRMTIFEGHTGDVTCVGFSPDEKYIITGSTDRTARLWNRSGVQVFEFKGFDAVLNWVSYSPGGKHILMAP
ncbi:MAG: WD40 repeat domain-containing protein, partial [bacterium]|nr:WD40 repeat domain-containing protein [bacterium]